MIHFTKYAEQKFEILNKHNVFITREQVEAAVRLPDKAKKKGKLFSACKDGVEVIYKKEGEIIRVITFFPIKC
ncbi:MAG: hypothetical protein WCW77_01045 [Patescibacteria group bacterium]|jgi:hypothetical protein